MDPALIFFLIMFAGFIFVVFTALMGGFGHMGGGDVDATGSDFGHGDMGTDMGHGDTGGDTGDGSGGHDGGGHDTGDGEGHGSTIHFPRLSPLVIAISATTFGGFGWMFQVFAPWIGIFIIVILALALSAAVSAGVFFGFMRTMARMQGSAVYQLADARGTVGAVTTPIQPGRIGVVDHELAGQTVSTSAKSDESLNTGDRVRIIMVSGDMLTVKKLRDTVPEDLMPGLENSQMKTPEKKEEPNMVNWFEEPSSLIVVVVMMAAVVLLTLAIYASRYQRVPPDKVMIIYGRARQASYSYMENGRPRTATKQFGFRIVRGGGVFVMPIFERVGWMSLETHTHEIKVPNIKTRDGKTLAVDLVAQVKIRSDDASLRTAAEQLLEKPQAEINEMATKIIEARARTTLSWMTLADINADRKATETRLAEAISEEYKRTGLQLSVFVLKDIDVDKNGNIMVSDESIKPGDLFKVVKNPRGELIVQRVTGDMEG
jgi:membrane protein implicated in regulation of membrane protease activity